MVNSSDVSEFGIIVNPKTNLDIVKMTNRPFHNLCSHAHNCLRLAKMIDVL